MNTTEVHFLRLPLTSPCPVPVEAGTGRTFDDDGEPLPMEQRTELCAVNAGWMIGAQRICDFHLRELFERGFFSADQAGDIADFEHLIYDAYGEYSPGAATKAIAESEKPWTARKRYSQEEARSWAESAKRGGLA